MNSADLVARLIDDYPQFSWRESDCPHWSPDSKTIFYSDDNLQTLHELGHALMNHEHYGQDIELLRLEREAWQVAQALAPRYNLVIRDDVVEDALDSYRDWLHRRSKCPKCQLSGIQSNADGHYYCPTCGASWLANSAKQTQLRRRLIQ